MIAIRILRMDVPFLGMSATAQQIANHPLPVIALVTDGAMSRSIMLVCMRFVIVISGAMRLNSGPLCHGIWLLDHRTSMNGLLAVA
jgi:hypothetical protein